jgi:glutathione peroxidase
MLGKVSLCVAIVSLLFAIAICKLFIGDCFDVFNCCATTMSSSDEKQSVHDFTVKKSDGTDQAMSEFKGKALLIVNTASQCGFTPQYAGLQALHKELGDKLAVLAFPCNQFGAQEPGDDAEIQQFCKRTYDVDFPVFKKINVNGDSVDPLWRFLKGSFYVSFCCSFSLHGTSFRFFFFLSSSTHTFAEKKKGILGTTSIKWNFTKFLVDKDGNVIERFSPTDKPESIKAAIEKLINADAQKELKSNQ